MKADLFEAPDYYNLDDLLSGLKTRNIEPNQNRNDENDSMVSVNSLRDTQNNVLPKRTRRKQKSDRNVVSLDI